MLFDFADLDCWYNGEQYTEDGIPTEHPHYNGDEAGHTTYESCENKGKAVWRMMARLAGWSGPETSAGISEGKHPDAFCLWQNHPNPFNLETMIRYQLPKQAEVRLKIYNVLGELVMTLVDEKQPEGFYTVRWNGMDEEGRAVASGVYLYRIEAGDFLAVNKMVILK